MKRCNPPGLMSHASFDTAVIASADFWLGVLMNVAWMSIYLSLGFILTEEHGVTGASVALLVSYCLHLTWTIIYAKNKLDKKSTVLSI